MRVAEREACILNLLADSGRIEVSTLAQQLGVSQVTMRKDLDALERRGVLRREHGVAVLNTDDVGGRLGIHYEQKLRIARCAAKLVSPGDMVMIESGSCCALLAEEIARQRADVTMITNSAFIAQYIRRIDGAHIVLLGGDYQNDAQVTVGPILAQCAKQFHVPYLFVGVDGYTRELGFMGANHLRVQAVRDMAQQADQTVVVTESSKLGRAGTVQMLLPKGVHTIVTDHDISEEAKEALAADGVVCLEPES